MPRRNKNDDFALLADEVGKMQAVLASMGINLNLPYPDEWPAHVPPDANDEFVRGAAFAVALLRDHLSSTHMRTQATERARYTRNTDELFR